MGIEALVIGGLASSAIGASSANKAAKAQTNAAKDANATQKYIFDRSVDLTEPQRKIGQNALATMQGMVGIGEMPAFNERGTQMRLNHTGTGTEHALQYLQSDGTWQDGRTFANWQEGQDYLDEFRPSFETSPGYQFRLGEGQKAIERMAAARGTRLSGDTLKEFQRYGEGLASSEYGDYWNRLAGLSGAGQTATSSQLAAGQNYANAYGNNALAAGQARASGYANTNNAIQSGFNNIFNTMGMANAGMFGANPTMFGMPLGG